MSAPSRNSSRQSSPAALEDFEYESRYVPGGMTGLPQASSKMQAATPRGRSNSGTPRTSSRPPESSSFREASPRLSLSKDAPRGSQSPASRQRVPTGPQNGKSGSQSRVTRAGPSASHAPGKTKKRAGQDGPLEERGRSRQKTSSLNETRSPGVRSQGKEPARTASSSTAATAKAESAIIFRAEVGIFLDLALERKVPVTKLDFLTKPFAEGQNPISMQTLLFHYQNLLKEERENLAGRSLSVKNFADRMRRYRLDKDANTDTYGLFKSLHGLREKQAYQKFVQSFALWSYSNELPVPVVTESTDGDKSKHPLIQILDTIGAGEIAKSPYKTLRTLQNPDLPAIRAAYLKDRDSFKRLLGPLTYTHLCQTIKRNDNGTAQGPQLRFLRKWVKNPETLPAQQVKARSSASRSPQPSPSGNRRSTSQHSAARRSMS